MKSFLSIQFLLLAFVSVLYSQEMRVNSNYQSFQNGGNAEWSNDLLVSASEPMGRPSGVYRNSDATIYVSIPDTSIESGSAIVIKASSNNGASWSNIASLQPASVVSKTKMIRSAQDSIYCFYIVNATIYCWNVLNGRITQVRGVGFRDFDVAASSTGSMYIFMDSLGTNNIPRYGSSDGGVTWGQRALVTGSGAHPRIYFSAVGDTLILNYYGPMLNDTATSIIRNARYRESAPGTMAVVGSFTDVVRSNDRKEEFTPVRHGLTAWVIYTAEESGNVDIKCKSSTNAGTTYNDSAVIASIPASDEFWFDAKHHNRGEGGVDIIYYSSASTDGGFGAQMNYISASKSSPLSFSSAVQFAGNPPAVSAAGYIPTLIPYYNSESDAGAIWVGETPISGVIGRALYFDRLLATSVLNITVNLEACSPVQDTVTVQLRSAVSPYPLVDSKKAYLSAGGTGAVNFTNALNGESYYIVVLHRNSIETWSKVGGETFSNGQLTFNFTTSASQAFGNNMVLVNGKYSFFTGDVNQDGIVDASDGSSIDNDAFNFVAGYVATDLNCDMAVDGTDAQFAENNANAFVGKITP